MTTTEQPTETTSWWTRSRKRRATTAGVALAVLAIAAAATAALMIQARLDASGTADLRAIEWQAGGLSSGNPDGPTIGTETGDGTCTTGLAAGVLSFDFDGFWAGSECTITADTGGYLRLANTNGSDVTVTGLSYPAGFGAPGSGEPIEVELLDGGNPATYPFDVAAGSAKYVDVQVTVNAATAEPGTSYAGQITVDGS